MQAMDWAALKRRGSASICEGSVPSEIACTRVIESIQAGVKIACTATKAARSSRSLRARRISINPKTTAVNTVRAVAMFATVERSTAAICWNASFGVTQISSCAPSVSLHREQQQLCGGHATALAGERSSPSISPHVGIPATLVHLDKLKIGEHAAIISQTKRRDHLSEDASLIIMPATFANETVVNQNLLLRELPAIGETPVKNFRVSFSRKHLSSDIFVADPQIPACPAIESLPQLLVIILRKLALHMQANLRTHPGKIKKTASLLETTFQAFNFHSDSSHTHGQPSSGTRKWNVFFGTAPKSSHCKTLHGSGGPLRVS